MKANVTLRSGKGVWCYPGAEYEVTPPQCFGDGEIAVLRPCTFWIKADRTDPRIAPDHGELVELHAVAEDGREDRAQVIVHGISALEPEQARESLDEPDLILLELKSHGPFDVRTTAVPGAASTMHPAR